jgi:ATP-binding cassette subfamily B protein
MNFDNIIIDALKDNKKIAISCILVLTSLFSSQIIFPKLCSNFITSLPENFKNLNFKTVLVVLIPYIYSEVAYYISDKIDSKTMPKIELNITHNTIEKIIESLKSTKKNINMNELILHIKRIFDIRSCYHLILSYVIPAIIVSIGIIFYFYKANTKLGILTFIILLLAFISLIKMGNDCFNKINSQEEQINIYCDEVHDILNNIDDVIVSGTKDKELEYMKYHQNNVYENCVVKEICNTNLKFTFSFVYMAIMLILNAFALNSYFNKEIDKSVLVTIFFMVLTLVQLYDSMLYELHNILSSIGNYKELRSYFNNFEIDNIDDLPDITLNNFNIIFKNINLNYDDKAIFKDFNLDIKQHTKTGIIGQIGSGKSSLLKILTNIIPYEGNIYINNIDTKDFNNESLMKYISYIPQNPTLFNRSIYDNLNYGSDYSIHEIQKYIDKLKVASFIKTLSNGLETIAGKNGENLSGGQRQLIYILRAIIQNKKIILLDEPTSALDHKYKQMLIDLLNRLHDKTFIIVTHDYDILNIFDRVVILENGKIIKDSIQNNINKSK